MPSTLLFVFIYCLWLILVFHAWLWEQGFVVTPLTDWLLSFHFFLFEEIPKPACLFQAGGKKKRGEKKGMICPENTPPATLTPRGHGNIHAGEHYQLGVLYYVLHTRLPAAWESDLTRAPKIKQVLPKRNWNGKFWVIQIVSSEATGLCLVPLTEAKHTLHVGVCVLYLRDMIKSWSTCITNMAFTCLRLQIVVRT